MVESGKTMPSSNMYKALILFLEKKGGVRLSLCNNYRSLNANTVMDSWPLPIIKELMPRFLGAYYCSKLDLRDGNFKKQWTKKNHLKSIFS